jgi:protocatechuate 3,4-dioxygenase alpha subunit
MADLTPFQTVGPFLSLGLGVGLDPLPEGDTLGGLIITGRLIDGRGEPIPDGVLEFWHPSFAECRRALSNDAGEFRIELARPHAVDGADGRLQAPHYAVRVLARGVLTQYVTRLYLDGQPMNADDTILALVPADRRATLLAVPVSDREYRFDVVLQGANETVFFDV